MPNEPTRLAPVFSSFLPRPRRGDAAAILFRNVDPPPARPGGRLTWLLLTLGSESAKAIHDVCKKRPSLALRRAFPYRLECLDRAQQLPGCLACSQVCLRGGVADSGFGITLAIECFDPRPVVGPVYGPAVLVSPHDVAAPFGRVAHRITVLIACSMSTPSTALQAPGTTFASLRS
jgi:hypothetical protein